MLHQVFSLVERLTPRVLSALVVFFLAARTDPLEVGLYSTITLAYTFVQATAETAVRQVLPSVLGEPIFLRRYVLVASFCLCPALFIVAVLTATLSAPGDGLVAFAPALVAITPIFNALSLASIGRLQLSDRWHVLAKCQLIGGGAAAVIALPLTLLFPPLFGASLFLPLAEAFNWRLTLRSARSVPPVRSVADEHASTRELFGISAYSSAGWLQGQADRVFLIFLSGTATLGRLSVASSLARAVADPMAGSTANILRARLHTSKLDDPSVLLYETLRTAYFIAGAASLLIIIVANTLGRIWLKPSWGPALDIVPILTIASFFTICNASLGTAQVYFKNLRRSAVVPASAISLAPIVALAASVDLHLAAWLIVGREVLVSIINQWTLRSRLDKRALLLTLVWGIVFSFGAGFGQALQWW